ncbi:MAG: cupin domain-containing protein [Holosporales bacterium]|nr:cupin domain-containing protein [Holosporales bacterium]
MKFTIEKIVWKNAFGIDIGEYFSSDNRLPNDCAIAKIRNGKYPRKINHGFYEMFYILDGECFIDLQDEVIQLKKQDVYVIEPEQAHTTRAEYADVLIFCTPPFDIKNVEFLEPLPT